MGLDDINFLWRFYRLGRDVGLQDASLIY